MAEHPTPGALVWRLAMKWRVAVDRAVAPLGLTHAQYVVLATLFEMWRGGQRPMQRQLAEHTGLEAVYVSKLVRRLEAAGIVDRPGDPADTRAVRLGLTENGADIARQAISVVAGLLEQLLDPLGGTRSRRTVELTNALQTLLANPLPSSTEGERP